MGKTKKLYWYVTVKRWVPNTDTKPRSRFAPKPEIGYWSQVKEIRCKSEAEAVSLIRDYNDRKDTANDGNRLWNANAIKK